MKALSLSLLLALGLVTRAMGEDGSLPLHLRSRQAHSRGTYEVSEKLAAWESKKTALIICDM
jgi:ankyrin repeat protein